MNFDKDAYGQEIWAYFKRKKSYELIERDDGYVGLSTGSPAYFQDFKNWPTQQKKAIVFAKGRILDVGTGAGRVALYLQRKGLDVTAIDNSPLAIKVCKARGITKTQVLPIEKIHTLQRNSFDTIVMYGNNFGLFGSFKKAKSLLKAIYKITKPEAFIIAESNDPYKTSNSAHLSYLKLNKRRGRMAGQLRIRVRFENYIGDWFNYLLVSKNEMKNIVKGTGWKIKNILTSAGSSYVAILEKE